MQSSNPIVGAAVSGYDETASLNYVPATSCASTAWWPGPTVDGSLDQRFQNDFSFVREFLENPGHQHLVNDNTAFQSIPENSMLSHSGTVDDRMFYYPQDPRGLPLEDDNLNQAYVGSQHGRPVWDNPGQFLPTLQVMASQPSTELLPIMMPPQDQLSFLQCAWTKDDKQCGHLIWGDKRKLGAHLRDSHGVQGNEKKEVVCLWNGCNHNMQRGAIGRHIISRHIKIRWTCEYCSKTYSRRDALRKHTKDCQAA
ncbi:hypothetical protein BDR04DRAFT_1117104 [Suillus decipiens]|nr:hypothetical protein BDR04DRAFT_1117104 [Suillus decipiens]